MFEHFGLMDIFSGFKKYKYIISTIIIFFTAFFVFVFFHNSKNMSNITSGGNENIYISTAVYYVEPNIATLGKAESSVYKSIPDDYVAVINSDFCRKYIFECLLNEYSNEYIVDNSGLGRSNLAIKASDMDINSMSELYQVKKTSNTMVIEVSSMTYSKDLSNSVISILKEFIIHNLDKQMVNSSIKLTGEANRSIKTSDIGLETIDKNDKRNIVKSPTVKRSTSILFLKKVIVPIILIVFLLTGLIIVKGLFNPTLNRASDFSEYNIPLIGEIKNFKKGLK